MGAVAVQVMCVASQAAKTASSTSSSTPVKIRRSVEREGTPRTIPRSVQYRRGRSAAQEAIASTDPALATTAANATASTLASRWRIPRAWRGSGTVDNTCHTCTGIAAIARSGATTPDARIGASAAISDDTDAGTAHHLPT